jgi:predicted MFS family arabinose efflux permease
MAYALKQARISAPIERAPSGAPLWVALGLAVGPPVAIGLARFAYALLLPPMRVDFAWSYSQAGAMNTANAAGYLAGAILTARLVTRHGERTVYLVGLFGTALSLIGCGAGDGFAPLALINGASAGAGAGSASAQSRFSPASLHFRQ